MMWVMPPIIYRSKPKNHWVILYVVVMVYLHRITLRKFSPTTKAVCEDMAIKMRRHTYHQNHPPESLLSDSSVYELEKSHHESSSFPHKWRIPFRHDGLPPVLFIDWHFPSPSSRWGYHPLMETRM